MNDEHAKRVYKVCCAYDTETTNIGQGANTRAYPVLYICNDLRDIDIAAYEFGVSDDIRFFRTESEMLAYVDDLVAFGLNHGIVPIICAYNLMFDLGPLMHQLAEKYRMTANAQTATSAYTVDLTDETGKIVLLRFWDTFYLEMNGLKAMGEVCGVPKAVGDWDYALIRTPQTPLTDLERHYAGRDTQVIPAYLRYLLDANDWLTPDMLGCRVLTKTSLVRQMARREIGGLRYRTSKGGRQTLGNAFEMTCKQEFPRTFAQYALRKACFRGGFTFTAGNNANKVWHNVISTDVTSMHHTFINGRMLPVHFKPMKTGLLTEICRDITDTTPTQVLADYAKPFQWGLHVRVQFDNLRLKKDSVFDLEGIGLIPEGKFVKTPVQTDLQEDLRARMAEKVVKLEGWRDYAKWPVFAFGKLVSAKTAIVHVCELELWNIAQVYDYDRLTVILGEATNKFTRPPDYVTLQSNLLFERKQDMKRILAKYNQGEPYTDRIPASIPEGLAKEIRAGTALTPFLESYYQSTVKGMFNGIFGTQAMDLMKPGFKVTGGDIVIDHDTITTPDNYRKRVPDKPRVLYTYGMRIVGGSRMHLVLALLLMRDALGDLAHPTGGDTDSIKVSVADDITDHDIDAALKPLADASDRAIDCVQRRVRKTAPKLASSLRGIGHFEVERAGDGTRWANHWEAWNKARLSASNGTYHITCAGLSRPLGAYHIEHWCADMERAGYSFEQIARALFGYNTYVENSVCHALQQHRPEWGDRYHGVVTDWQGNTAMVDAPEAVALYPVGRWLGELDKRASVENIQWLQAHGDKPDSTETWIGVDDTTAYALRMDENGEMQRIMEAPRHDH